MLEMVQYPPMQQICGLKQVELTFIAFGNVGIGSASPGEKLDVVGNIKR